MENININIMLLVVVIALVCKMVDGYKKGMVKEVVSMISMVVLCVVVALIAHGVSSYLDGKIINVIAAVILLGLLGIVHHLLQVVLFPAKLVSKLPIVHSVDKLLGIVFGAAEVILVLWTVYAFIMMMDTGIIGQMILSYTEENKILLWFYQHNYIAVWIDRALTEFSFIPLL